jgi:glycosyltransferase involved in cell wall biosynthesis
MADLLGEKRLRIGILFYFSPKWMGGIVYIINLIKTLDFLKDEDKPEVFLFYRPDLRRFLCEFNYPYINFIEWSFPSVIKGNIMSLLLGKNLFIDKILGSYSLDTIFPIHDFPVRTLTKVRLISWWADLQEKYYPEFFTPIQRLGRSLRVKRIIKNCNILIVSSQAVMDDFEQFYKPHDGLKIYVFHFVSVIDNIGNTFIDDLRVKYSLPEQYFLVSNQFHKHKNHKVLLLALSNLKRMGVNVHIAFTGRFPTAPDSPYLNELYKLIDENDLHNCITMLGLISRSDQLLLMRNSQAVIQPSLFEGWSTVIEDAKSLQVPVIASNLKVHIEQLGKDGCYFDPHDPEALGEILRCYPERDMNRLYYPNYSERIREAANQLYNFLIS